MQGNYTCDEAELLRQQTEKANLPNKSLMSWKNLSRSLRRLLPIQKKMPARASFSVQHPAQAGYAPLKQEIT